MLYKAFKVWKVVLKDVEKVYLDFGFFRLKLTLKTFTNSDILAQQASSNFQTDSNSDCLSLRHDEGVDR